MKPVGLTPCLYSCGEIHSIFPPADPYIRSSALSDCVLPINQIGASQLFEPDSDPKYTALLQKCRTNQMTAFCAAQRLTVLVYFWGVHRLFVALKTSTLKGLRDTVAHISSSFFILSHMLLVPSGSWRGTANPASSDNVAQLQQHSAVC